jgi:TRAP transporter TAXI family solute receptor
MKPSRYLALATLAGLALAPVEAGAQQFINILTGGTSGAYYPLGVALAEIYGNGIPNAKTQVLSTKASVENLNLLQQGRGEIAFAPGDSLAFAWAGVAEAGFRGRLDKLRALAAIYPIYIQIIATKGSGVRTLADLKGKSLAVGAPRSGTDLGTRAILKAAGMTYGDLGKVEYLSFAQAVERMKNRQLDATLQPASLGVVSIRDLAATNDINLVSIPQDLVQEIGAPYVAAIIPANTYPGQEEAVPTVAVVNFLVTHVGVTEETGYQMTKLVFENMGQLQAAHQAAKDLTLEASLAGMPLPLHPGAERYFKEKGLRQ